MRILEKIMLGMALIAVVVSCQEKKSNVTKDAPREEFINIEPEQGDRVATFASGCFWCVEEVFESLAGVRESISGYAGGTADDANYEAVSRGSTDHAETVQIYYDTALITYDVLVAAFFASHDPTTLNRQGPDSGRQYRSIAFYRNEIEKEIIMKEISRIDSSGMYKNKIVTEILPFTTFYPAEKYHQDYVEANPNEPYVRGVSVPRYEKFRKEFKGKFKNTSE